MLAAASILTACAGSKHTASPKKIVEKKYYGTSASNDPANPCKGETTRLCAIVTTTYEDKVTTEIVKDGDGNTVSVKKKKNKD